MEKSISEAEVKGIFRTLEYCYDFKVDYTSLDFCRAFLDRIQREIIYEGCR